jgi:pimeloyl-ACP methyl ester carboxylesterase
MLRPDIVLLQDGDRMSQTNVYFREVGSGAGVVCIHSNASSSGQWRALMELLAPEFHVVAPDLYDSGKSPAWSSDRALRLDDEVTLLEPALTRAGSPLMLVGHSYGGAVALMAALARPDRVRAVALYEPTLFSLLDAESPAPNDADGIRNAVEDAAAALDRGERDAAAERFIDYWSGPGTWKAMPEDRKAPIAASMTNVRRWGHALFGEPTLLAAFRALHVPVFYMTGKRSQVSALGVARLLTSALPRVERVEFEDMGHMGPITHPGRVNETIRAFLRRAAADQAPEPARARSVRAARAEAQPMPMRFAPSRKSASPSASNRKVRRKSATV